MNEIQPNNERPETTTLGSEPSVSDSMASQAIDPIPDSRLYVPDHEDWNAVIKRDSDRVYCYSKHPGEEWFHLILNGEIHITRQHERYCLRCALRMGFLTTDRLNWQHRVPKKPPRVL
jgi:hypothetical protein